MLKRITFFLISFCLIVSITTAQYSNTSANNQEVLPAISKKVSKKAAVNKGISLKKTMGVVDTLNHDLSYQTPFTFSPGEVMVKWYTAPTDLILKGCAIDFYASSDFDATASAEIKVVKLNYTNDDIFGYPSATWLGYYEGTNPHNISPFLDDESTTGGWVSKGDNTEPFAEDLWSDEGYGAPLPVDQIIGDAYVYTYVDFEKLLGYGPDIASGEVFGIVIKNTTPADAAQPDSGQYR